MSSKKIIIMTAPFGGGHHSTAQTVAQLIKSQQPTASVKVLDVISDSWPAFGHHSSRAYVNSASKSGGFWFNAYYQLTDRWPQPLRWLGSATFRRYARRKIREEQPDLIIATFPFLGHIAAQARDYHDMKVPIVTMVTDAGQVQGIWLCGSEDVILTATPDTVEYALRRGVDAERVKYIGFPVASEFTTAPTRTEARHHLQLDERLFTVLITAGGLGMSQAKVLRLARRLATSPIPLQLVFVAGRNETLKRELSRIEFPAHVRTSLFGYTDDMPLLMSACDLVCTKAGWLTINEAVSVKRPLVLFDAIPGHEEHNAAYVENAHYGIYLSDAERAADYLIKAATDPACLRPYQQSLGEKADAGDTMAKLARFYRSLLR